MKTIKTLGVFDSGLGGYSVYHYLKSKLPYLNLVLYADQANAPYGNQSKEAITGHANRAMDWFASRGIDDVVVACNTVSSVSLPEMRENHPNMNILGIIELTVSKVERKDSHVGVISTQATHDSNAYIYALKSAGVMDVVSKPLPNLVTLIEGLEPVDAYLKMELESLKDRDVLILACTHYPLVEPNIKKLLDAQILDSREAIVETIESQTAFSTKKGNHHVITTGSKEILKQQLESIFGFIEDVEDATWNL